MLGFVDRQLEEFDANFKAKHEIKSDDTDLDKKSIIYRGTTFYHKDPKKFPKEALQTVAMMNVFAGTDTTAIALTSIIYYLTMFPKTLTKVCNHGIETCVAVC